MRKLLTLLTAAAVAMAGGLTLASAANAESDGKVYVCKYVTTPGEGEVLQTGMNPIEVSVNAIPDYTDGMDVSLLVGKMFTDGQGRSIVIAVSAGPGGGQGDEPTIDDCPPPDLPDLDVASAVVTVTPATCVSGAILVYGAVANAVFSGTANGTVGPASYSVTATADADARFAGDLTTLSFTGTLAGPLTGEACDEPGVVLDVASAVVTVTPATCVSGAILVYGAVANAVFSGTANGTVGPASYSVTATADADARFAGDLTTLSFTGTLAGPLTGEACDEPGVVVVVQQNLVTTTIDCVNYMTSTQAQSSTGGGAWVNVGDAVVVKRATTQAEINSLGLDCVGDTIVVPVTNTVIVPVETVRTVTAPGATRAAPAAAVTAQPTFTG